jgi:hypothetical protein
MYILIQSSIVAQKNAMKNIFGWTEVKQYTPSGGAEV